jgi:hypothetical protein
MTRARADPGGGGDIGFGGVSLTGATVSRRYVSRRQVVGAAAGQSEWAANSVSLVMF